MNENIRIVKNTVIIYIRLIVTAFAGLFASRFMLRALGASDFGTYNVVGSLVTMMVFVNTMMVSSTYRFIAFETGKGENGDVNKVFNTSLAIHLFISILFVLIAATIGVLYINNYLNVEPEKIPDASFVFWCSVIASVFSIVSVPFQGYLTAKENFSVLAVIAIIYSLLQLLGAGSLLIIPSNRLRVFGVFHAIALSLSSSLYIVYCLKKYTAEVKWHFSTDKKMYKDMLNYSGWIALGAAASAGQQQGTAIVINHFFSTIVNAAYGIANSVRSMVGQFTRSISQSAIPQIIKKFSANDQKRSVDLASYVSKYTLFLMLLFSTPVILEIDFLLDLWLGADAVPEGTSLLCQLTLIQLCIDGFGEGVGALIQASGKIKWFQIVYSVTTLSVLPIVWGLYKIGLPPETILYAFMCSSIVNVVVRQILLNKLLSFDVKRFLQISYFRVLYVVICLLPIFFIVPMFPEGLFRFLITVPLSMIYVLVAIYIAGLSNSERNRIIVNVKKVLKIND